MATYNDQVVLDLIARLSKNTRDVFNNLKKDLDSLNSKVKDNAKASQSAAKDTQKLSDAQKGFGDRVEATGKTFQKYNDFFKQDWDEQGNQIRSVKDAWAEFSKGVEKGGQGLEYAKKQTQTYVSRIQDLQTRLNTINPEWKDWSKNIDFNNVKLAEQQGLIKGVGNSYQIMREGQLKLLNLSKDQVKQLGAQNSSYGLYNKTLEKAQTISQNYTNAVQKLGKSWGTSNAKAATWIKSLDQVNTAIDRQAKSFKASTGLTQSWANKIELASATNALLKNNLSIANNQLKANNAEGLKALKITEDQAARAGMLSKQYSDYGTTLQSLYRNNKALVPTFQELTKTFGTSDAAVQSINKTLTQYQKNVGDKLQKAQQTFNRRVQEGVISQQKANEAYARVEKNLSQTGKVLQAHNKRLKTATTVETEYGRALGQNVNTSTQFKKALGTIADQFGKNSPVVREYAKTLRTVEGYISKTAVAMNQAGQNGKKYYETTDRLTTAQKLANGQLKAVNGILQEGTRSMGLFQRALNSVVGSLKNMASYAAGAAIFYQVFTVFRTGITAIFEYSQALKDLQAILNATEVEVEILGDTIQDVAGRTKFSTTEIADGMKTLGQAGLSTFEILETVEEVAKLATGTMTEFKTVSDLVTTTIRAFGKEAYDSGEIVDVFANAVNRSKLTVDKLRIAFNYVSPVAAKAGVTFKETSAAMMTLANAGIRASTIGTGLRQVIRRLINPNEKLQEAIKRTGYTLDDLNPMYNEFSTIIERLNEVVPTAADAFQFFKVRGAPAVSALTQNGVEGFKQLEEAIEEVGAASRMMQTQQEGLGITAKQVADKFSVLSTELGEAGLISIFKGFLEAVKLVEDALIFLASTPLTGAIGQFIALSVAITGASAALKALVATSAFSWLSGLVSSVGMATTSFAGLGTAVVALGKKLKALFALLMRHPLILVATGAAALVTLLVKMRNETQKLVEENKKLILEYQNTANKLEYYKERLNGVTKGSDEYRAIMQRLVEDVPELRDEIDLLNMEFKDGSSILDEYIKKSIGKALAAEIEILDSYSDKIAEINKEKAGLEVVGLDTSEAETRIKELNNTIQGSLEDIAQRIYTFSKESNEDLDNITVKKLKESFEDLEDLSETQLSSVVDQIKEMASVSVDLAKEIEKLPPHWEKAFEQLPTDAKKQELLDMINNYKDASKKIMDTAKAVIKDSGGDIEEITEDKIAALNEKFQKMAEKAFGSNFKMVWDGVKDAVDQDIFGEVFGDFTDKTKDTFSRRRSIVERHFDWEINKIRNSTDDEIEQNKRILDAQKRLKNQRGMLLEQEYQERKNIVVEEMKNMLSLYEDDAEKQKEIYQETNRKLLDLSDEFTDKKEQNLNQWKDTLVNAYNTAKQKSQEYYDEIKDLEQELIDLQEERANNIRKIEASLASDLYDIRKAGMNDMDAVMGDFSRANDLYQEAQNLIDEGKFEMARDLLKDSASMYKQIAVGAKQAKKEGERYAVSSSSAIAGLKNAYGALEKVENRQKEEEIENIQKQITSFKELKTQVDGLATRYKSMISSILNDLDAMDQMKIEDKQFDISSNVDEQRDKINELNRELDRLNARTVSYNVVKTVSQVAEKALGGIVEPFARGGSVPGSGNEDTVPAKLTPGEYVMPKNRVAEIGVEFFEALRMKGKEALTSLSGIKAFNFGGLVDSVKPDVQKFNAGGLVSQHEAKETMTATLNLQIGDNKYPVKTTDAVLKDITKELRRKGLAI